jgi:hypothetical protein
VISLGIFIVFSILAVRPATRLLACLALTTLVVPFYLFEIYVRVTAAPAPDKVKYEAELREQGVAAYPAVFPRGFLDLWQNPDDNSSYPIVIQGRRILPLAGIPDVLDRVLLQR